MKNWLNDKSFEHISCFGTVFRCKYCDFREIIYLHNSPSKKDLQMRDLAEMIGYHAVNIRPDLNGFQGYDCLRFEFV